MAEEISFSTFLRCFGFVEILFDTLAIILILLLYQASGDTIGVVYFGKLISIEELI
jgi:hypothetical protein